MTQQQSPEQQAKDRQDIEQSKRLKRLSDIAEREYELGTRVAYLSSASNAVPERPRALWMDEQGRGIILPLGEISLLNGQGGLAKSTLLCWIAARVTRGELAGEHFGTPKSVIMDMREDDYASITLPRLMAAGADLTRIYAPALMDSIDGTIVPPEFPGDADRLAAQALKHDVALYCLDPLPSSMAGHLKQNDGQHVRRAFQPLMRAGRAVGMATLGICHNKKDDHNPVTAISGATFRDIARAVISVIPNPEEGETDRKMLGITKSNYGRNDLPARYYDVEERTVQGRSEFEHIPAIRIVMGDEAALSIAEAMEMNADTASSRGASTECKEWLEDYMRNKSGQEAEAAEATKAAMASAGKYSVDQLRSARKKLRITSKKAGKEWIWRMP